MSKKKTRPSPSQKAEKVPKKRVRFSRLYIAAAVCTACVCLAVVTVMTQFSRSAIRWEPPEHIAIPTPEPVDSILNSVLAAASPTPIGAPPESDGEPPAAEEEPSGVPADGDGETQEVGLFQKMEPFSIRMPLEGAVTAEFSADRLKKSKTMGDWRTHNGVDIGADAGTAVNAAADGVVSVAGYDQMMGYVVVLDHEDGYQTLYANLASCEMVEPGQSVKAGECLGAVGDSAVFEKLESTHLHFELTHNGAYENPLELLLQAAE